MDNSLFINEICIGLLGKCNWNCKYCIAKNNISFNEDDIIEQIVPMKDKLKTLWLSGGEPGILSDNFWNKLFNLTEYKLKICTNGTFILNGFADKYESKINAITIHCVEELDQDINPIVLNFIKTTKIKLQVNVVIHRYNAHLIKSFLQKYNDINIVFNFSDESFCKIPDYKYYINKDAAIEIIKQLSGFKHYGIYTTRLAKCIIKNNFKYINPWSIKN